MMRRNLRQFYRHNHGVAFIEFAMVFPVFFLLLFGGIELNRLILIQQKLEKAGYVISDVITQYNPATAASVAGEINQTEMHDNVFPQLGRMMATYANPAMQAVIVTSVKVTPNSATIDWQMAGGGELSGCDGQNPATCVTSIVNGLAPADISPAVRGTPAAFPAEQAALVAALPMQIDKAPYTLMVSEVFYFYHPIIQKILQDVGAAGGKGFAGFNFFLPPRIYVKRTYFLPRQNSTLFDLPPQFPVP